jgi:hypothetical protein
MFTSSLLILALGLVFFAAFGYVNLVLHPRWYPGDMPGDRASLRRGGAKSTRSDRMVLGIAELGLFLIGAGLVTAAGAQIGTLLGYGGG